MSSHPLSAAAGDIRPIAVIVDREGLGDVLLKVPMLRAIGRGFPGRPIWWIAAFQTRMADDLQGYFHDLVTEVRSRLAISSGELQKVPRLQDLPAFSIVFDTRTRWASVWHARRMLRRDHYYCCCPGYLLSDSRPGRLMRPRHIGERSFSLAQSALGMSADGGGTLGCGEAARDIARALLPPGPVYVGIAVGSGEARKNWPLERFIDLARALATQGRTPVFLLGPQEAAACAEAARQIPGAIALDFTQIELGPRLGIFEATVAVAQRLALVVANDSGLGHLAGAAGRAVVSLFGPTDPRRWAPITPVRRIVRSQDYGGEDMSAIPVAAVLKAVDSVLLAEMEKPR